MLDQPGEHPPFLQPCCITFQEQSVPANCDPQRKPNGTFSKLIQIVLDGRSAWRWNWVFVASFHYPHIVRIHGVALGGHWYNQKMLRLVTPLFKTHASFSEKQTNLCDASIIHDRVPQHPPAFPQPRTSQRRTTCFAQCKPSQPRLRDQWLVQLRTLS